VIMHAKRHESTVKGAVVQTWEHDDGSRSSA
jgi:hypothetical protein